MQLRERLNSSFFSQGALTLILYYVLLAGAVFISKTLAHFGPLVHVLEMTHDLHSGTAGDHVNLKIVPAGGVILGIFVLVSLICLSHLFSTSTAPTYIYLYR